MRVATILFSMLFLAAGGKEPPSIEGLRATRQNQTILVSFELTGAFDEPTLERIQSGLPTEFRYLIRVEKPRRWWFDGGVDRTTLQIVATYNAVTMEYLVNYKLDGKLIDSRVVGTTEDLERAMTLISSVAAFELQQDPKARWFLRVRAELGSRNFLLLFTRTITTNWARFRLAQMG